jgi:hypothetical protein
LVGDEKRSGVQGKNQSPQVEISPGLRNVRLCLRPAAIISVFAFFSNRLGCLGSIVVSVIGTILLLALMRGCSGGGVGGGW